MILQANRRNGNLHISVKGSFTEAGAAKLTMLMSTHYYGKGNIFIHTDDISEIDPKSKDAFNDLVNTSGLPGNNIYLMGDKGRAICHDGGKVIERKKRKSAHYRCGRCQNCGCGGQEQ